METPKMKLGGGRAVTVDVPAAHPTPVKHSEEAGKRTFVEAHGSESIAPAVGRSADRKSEISVAPMPKCVAPARKSSRRHLLTQRLRQETEEFNFSALLEGVSNLHALVSPQEEPPVVLVDGPAPRTPVAPKQTSACPKPLVISTISPTIEATDIPVALTPEGPVADAAEAVDISQAVVVLHAPEESGAAELAPPVAAIETAGAQDTVEVPVVTALLQPTEMPTVVEATETQAVVDMATLGDAVETAGVEPVEAAPTPVLPPEPEPILLPDPRFLYDVLDPPSRPISPPLAPPPRSDNPAPPGYGASASTAPAAPAASPVSRSIRPLRLPRWRLNMYFPNGFRLYGAGMFLLSTSVLVGLIVLMGVPWWVEASGAALKDRQPNSPVMVASAATSKRHGHSTRKTGGQGHSRKRRRSTRNG